MPVPVPGVVPGAAPDPLVDPGVAVGAGVVVGAGAGDWCGVAVGCAVGRGVAVGAAVGVGLDVGRGVAVGVGVGVGVGTGAVIVTVPPAISSLNRRVSAASNEIVWVPIGSRVDHVLRTPAFQFVLPLPVIAWATPSITTETWSGADPSRLRYSTVNTIVVVGLADRGLTAGS